jgi:hypothetical protein
MLKSIRQRDRLDKEPKPHLNDPIAMSPPQNRAFSLRRFRNWWLNWADYTVS